MAADLPAETRSALRAWAQAAFGGAPALRLIAEDALHVTLCFLGGRPEAECARIGEAVLGCAGPARGLVISEAAWLPPRRPRLAVADIADPAGGLASLQARVVAAMQASAGHEPETRPFRPHVTVTRVRGRERLVPFAIPAPPRLAFDAGALTLYRSRTGPGGAVYEPLARVAL